MWHFSHHPREIWESKRSSLQISKAERAPVWVLRTRSFTSGNGASLMAAITPVKPLLRSSIVLSDSTCSLSSRCNSIALRGRGIHSRSQSRISTKSTKWENFVVDDEKTKAERPNFRDETKKKTREGIVTPRAQKELLLDEIRGEHKIRVPERFKVAILTAFVMCLCNANRVVMSVAIVPLAAQHGWNTSFSGIVQSSFLWGYMISSLVGGALVDRYGGKRVMAWGVGMWSLATFLTPWVANHSTAMLLAVRALFGLAAGVALPSMTTLMSRWFPCHERASAVGISMAGFHLGNVVCLLLSPVLMSKIGISGPFSLFSSVGLLCLIIWAYGITNDPAESHLISKVELRLIQAGKIDSSSNIAKLPPLRLLLSKRPSWAIIFANITNNWGYFVLLSWMPVYFKTVFNVNLKQAAWFSAIPWAMMAISGYLAGLASDSLINAGYSITPVRKMMQSIGFIGPGVSLLCLNLARTPTVAAMLLTVALSLSSFSQAGFLLNMEDVAPQYAGFLHGIANSFGTLAAIISTIGTGYFVQWLGSFQAFLTVTAVLYFITTVFWNLYATGERVF